MTIGTESKGNQRTMLKHRIISDEELSNTLSALADTPASNDVASEIHIGSKEGAH